MTESQKEIKIPQIPEEKLNEDILKRIEIIRASLSTTKNVNIVEKDIAKNYNIPVGTQYYWKAKLRKIFSLPPRTSLLCVASHPQIRQALAYILTHKERSDKGTLLKGKNLVVVIDGQDIPLDHYLFSTYLQEGRNAVSTYHALEKKFENGQVLVMPNKTACPNDNLPGISSIRRYLRKKATLLKNTSENDVSLNNDPFRVSTILKENLKKDITTIIEFCNEIHNELGSRHREVVYHRAIEKELRLRFIPYEHEAETDIDYKGALIGKDRVDFLTSGGILIEIKAKISLDHVDCDQAKRYLRSFDGKACILVNFGSRTIQIKKYSKRTSEYSKNK